MFAVLFEVEPKPERRDEYLKLAAFLKPALEKIDGFVDVERFASLSTPGRVLSFSLWRDEKSVIRWRTLGAHHEVQAKGRTEIFSDYHLRVGEITFDSELPDGEAPSQWRFDETEIAAAKAVTLSEFRDSGADALAGLGLPAEGLVSQEAFESIYNPGKLLLLAAWLNAASAGRWTPESATGTLTRRRHVHIIRD